MVETKRKPGRKVSKTNPVDVYNRNRQRYYYKLSVGNITAEEYNELMDENLKEYNRDKKIHKSLKEFE
jgi:hypothetical protein